MTVEDLNKIVLYIASECVKLKDKYTDEKDLAADYVCIFAQSLDEYRDLLEATKKIGKLAGGTLTGPVYAFNNRPQTAAGKPKLLKIRKPDATRTQRGDVDFNTSYEEFKKKYLDNKRFTLVVRPEFEMIELMDNDFDVRVYFSSIPLSKTLGVS